MGTAGTLSLPQGGRVIDGTGKTLVPGLWDAHTHFGNGNDLLANVAVGMTSIRSPGNGLELLVSAKQDRAAGKMVAPEIFGAIIIDRDLERTHADGCQIDFDWFRQEPVDQECNDQDDRQNPRQFCHEAFHHSFTFKTAIKSRSSNIRRTNDAETTAAAISASAE